MGTVYDWHPEKRGWLLMPQGSASIRHSVIVSGLCGHDVFLEMYERGHLTGQALAGRARTVRAPGEGILVRAVQLRSKVFQKGRKVSRRQLISAVP